MGGIVLKLQKETLDETISIGSLLRKAYLVKKVWNPYNGWIPMIVSADIADEYSEV